MLNIKSAVIGIVFSTAVGFAAATAQAKEVTTVVVPETATEVAKSGLAGGVFELDGIQSIGISDHPAAKVNFGFVIKPFDTDNKLVNSIGVGYRQTLHWNLNGSSKSITDHAYNPFVTANILDTSLLGIRGTNAKVNTTVEHLTNGKSGLDQRQVNYWTVKPELRWNLTDSTKVGVSTQYRHTINSGTKQTDYFDVMGRWKTEAFVQYGDYRVSAWGAGTSGGGDIHYRLTDIQGFGALTTYVQYFHGRGDQLIDYREKSRAVRIGIAIVPDWK